MPDKYFIPDGYVVNDEEITAEVPLEAKEKYWTESRIHLSSIYQWHVYQYALESANKYGVRSILDVGCGVGTKLASIKNKAPEIACTGLDQPHAIEVCKQKFPHCDWFDVDIREMKKVVSHDIDLVISSDVIEHLKNPDTLLNFIKTNSSEKSKIIISTPDREKFHGAECLHSPNPAHVREWGFSEFRSYIESKGIRIIEHFHVPAYRLTFDKPILKQEMRRLLKFKPQRNNQVILGEFSK